MTAPLPRPETRSETPPETGPETGPDPAAALPRLAYLTNWYPAVSLTFVLREIAALRDLGAEVLPCSIRRSPPGQHPGPAERAEAARTFNVIAAARRPLTLAGGAGFALARPGRLARALGLAWRTRRPGLRGLVWQAAYLAEAMVLARHLHRVRAGHLHVHFVGGVATAGMLAAELARLPFSLTVHGPTDFEDAAGWRLDLKVARAAFVACISHFARSQVMIHADPGDWDKLRIVHCGVDPALYDRPRAADAAETAGGDGPVRLLFVGRLAPVKGLRILIEALRRAALPVHLTVIGDGPDRAHLERAAAALGGRVRFTGYLDQEAVAARLAGADIVVLPSFAEGVPVMLMEAMAAGLPVIATQVAGTAELVEDSVSGLLVPPGDALSLARAIDALAADPDRRARLGAAGRARVRAAFDIRDEARRLAALFAGGGDDVRPAPWPESPADTAPAAAGGTG
jgi:glycosyltransferase involved in cell wall biosynthesis